MLVDKVQVLRFPEGVHGGVEFTPPPQVHGSRPMLVAGDLDARQVGRFEFGRVRAALDRCFDLALYRRLCGKSTSELGCREENVAPMAWNCHAIEQMRLPRQHRVDGVGRPKFDFHTDRRDLGLPHGEGEVSVT